MGEELLGSSPTTHGFHCGKRPVLLLYVNVCSNLRVICGFFRIRPILILRFAARLACANIVV